MNDNTIRPDHPAAVTDCQWRGAPFWALNGALEPEEIRRQIRGFHALGLGGFFLHARTGLSTAYLSERWFECLAAAVDEARQCGMHAWLYDEDRFPSGSAGGLLTCEPRHRGGCIFLEELPAAEADGAPLPEHTVAVFAAMVSGDYLSGVRRLPDQPPFELTPGESRLCFYTGRLMCNSWYNHYTYPDTLNPETIDRFIELTHEAYAVRFGADFGGVIPGIFTDEPRYGFYCNLPEWEDDRRYAVPWTPGLLEEFSVVFGYDPLERLPELFFAVDGVDSTAPRVHYIELLTRKFIHAYAENINRWCEKHHLMLTGHVIGEDSLSYQAQCVGSAMRFYEHMGMPGMDLLTEHHRAYQTAKQVASVARQFNRPRRLTETYGCTGWDFPLAGQKALGDWQFALGINFRCQHLAFYTMEGEAKRDYPCNIALQSNAPESYHALEDYFARLSPFLSSGAEKRDILVLSPVESAWALAHRNWRKLESTRAFDHAFTSLSHLLLAHQLDFDYGDEDILARHARVSIRDGVARLSVHAAEYSVVVVPKLLTMRRSTLELLRQFHQAGGKVLLQAPLPSHVDGFPVAPLKEDFPLCATPERLLATLEEYRLLRAVDVDGNGCRALLYQYRTGPDYDTLFVCNTGHAVDEAVGSGDEYDEPGVFERQVIYPALQLWVATDQVGEVIEFDAATGCYHRVEACRTERGWEFTTAFDRLQSRLFLFAARPGLFPVEARPDVVIPKSRVPRAVIAPDRWHVRLTEPNVLVLDHFSSALSDKPEFVLALDDRLRRHFDLPVRNFMMAQPWTRLATAHPGYESTIHASFVCDIIPAGELFLVLEHPELYVITLNGRIVPRVDAGFWHQPAWRKCRIAPELLRSGVNTLALTTRFNAEHPGLESVFLIGDFGVRLNDPLPALTTPVRQLAPGNWVSQGLPFFPGSVIYQTDVHLPAAAPGVIRIERFDGTPAYIRIQGAPVRELLFSPGEVAFPELPADFQLEVEINGSMRNVCGPFFQTHSPVWYGPEQFKSTPNPTRQFSPQGLHSPIIIF